MAGNQSVVELDLAPFSPTTPTSAPTTLAISSSGPTWLALGFTPDSSKTLSAVRVYATAGGAGLGVNDLSCEIWTAASGPSALIASAVCATTTGGSNNIVTPQWIEFSSFTTPPALTAGTMYYAVFKNASATTITLQYGASSSAQTSTMGSGTRYGWTKWHTANGSTWGTSAGCVFGLRVQFNDSTYIGMPVQNVAVSTDKIFTTTETGIVFTTPANAVYNLRGASFWFINHSATGDVVYKLYSGTAGSPTLVATTNHIPQATVISDGYFTAYFSASQALQPSTTYRLTRAQTSGSASAYIQDETEYTWDADSNSTALLPFNGTCKKTVTTNGGTSFTDDTGTIHITPFALLLDTLGQFSSSGGGGGGAPQPIVARGAYGIYG